MKDELSPVKIEFVNFGAFYRCEKAGSPPVRALEEVGLKVYDKGILSVIGPSRSGKTSLLRSVNRLNDLQPNFEHRGEILIDGVPVYGGAGTDVTALRRKAGMVFARPVVLPLSIYENIAYGPRLMGRNSKSELDATVESALKDAYLWEEVKDRLSSPAASLSGGQRQRLCIARVLGMRSGIIMLDEPTSALDPVSTAKIEETLTALKNKYCVILVTNNVKQAARVGDKTAFFLMGRLIEYGDTAKIFTTPRDERTENYITGRFG
ncbi:MAG TPA: phosphate ABC transporter ATP-binding protein [Candidatus Wallbacteria bacterium]|nr:phosphate ABC transporter ATP-binding protein [Candidatus Wallbacteria bacterium]